jgi:alginate O-acetyltransferase complex protein AlgI
VSTLTPLVVPPGRAIATLPGVAEKPRAAVTDRRIDNTRTDVMRFLALTGQLGLLFVIFSVYRVEESGFLRVAALSFGAFAIHYWLPFAWKEPFWIATSLVGAVMLVGPVVASLVAVFGLALFALLASPLTFRWKLTAVLVLAVALMYGRATLGFGLPREFWPVLGSIFMFRLMIYLYDLRFTKSRLTLREYLVYFFPLPNFYFLLFPVIDFQTMRRTYYQRNIHDIAQQGILWMVRGAVQLSLYRLIYHLKAPFTPDVVTSFGQLLLGMTSVYLLYLRVSGQFHIAIGLLHLFGYDLPETHRKYLLSNSLTDFWRRINIYWKDFMVKLVYFPLYFRWRRSGEVRAQIIATTVVFVVTWALHSYQWFWLNGQVLLTWPDTLFWAILGACVVINVLLEDKRRRDGKRPSRSAVVRNLQVAGTFIFIIVLWSLWNAPSIAAWIDVLTWWQIG